MSWSSITCELLPIHSVKTITWFSDKSEMASIGFLVIENAPYKQRCCKQQYNEPVAKG